MSLSVEMKEQIDRAAKLAFRKGYELAKLATPPAPTAQFADMAQVIDIAMGKAIELVKATHQFSDCSSQNYATGTKPTHAFADESDPDEDRIHTLLVVAELLKGKVDDEDLAKILGDLADSPEDYDAIADGNPPPASMEFAEWVYEEGPRGGKRWKNASTGRYIYSQDKPGGDREAKLKTREEAHASANQIIRDHIHGKATPDQLRELLTHIPHLTHDQLSSVRTRLMASFGGKRKLAERIEALKGHIEGMANSGKKEKEVNAKLDAHFGDKEKSATPFPRGERSIGNLDVGKGELADTPTQKIPIDQLHASQDAVNRDTVEHMMHNGKGSEKPVTVVKEGGKLHIEDGHHRATAAALNGEKHVNARVIDLDAKKPPVHPSIENQHVKPEDLNLNFGHETMDEGKTGDLKRNEDRNARKDPTVAEAEARTAWDKAQQAKKEGAEAGKKKEPWEMTCEEAMQAGVPASEWVHAVSKAWADEKLPEDSPIYKDASQFSDPQLVENLRRSQKYLGKTVSTPDGNTYQFDKLSEDGKHFILKDASGKQVREWPDNIGPEDWPTRIAIDKAINNPHGNPHIAGAKQIAESVLRSGRNISDVMKDLGVGIGTEGGKKLRKAVMDQVNHLQGKLKDVQSPQVSPELQKARERYLEKNGIDSEPSQASAPQPPEPNFTGRAANGVYFINGVAQKQADEAKGGDKLGEKPATKTKKPKISESDATLSHIIKNAGGIRSDDSSFKAHFGSIKEAMEYGLSLGLFNKNAKQGLDQIAKSMAEEGHLIVPDGEDPVPHLVEGLKRKARSAAEDLTKKYDKAYEEYAQSLEEAQNESHSAPDIAEALREGQRAGEAEGAEDKYGQSDSGTGVDTDFGFGANEPKQESGSGTGPVDLFGNPIPKSYSAKAGQQITMDDALREAWVNKAHEWSADNGIKINSLTASGTFKAGGKEYQVGKAEDGYPISEVGGKPANQPQYTFDNEKHVAEVANRLGVSVNDLHKSIGVSDSNAKIHVKAMNSNQGEVIELDVSHPDYQMERRINVDNFGDKVMQNRYFKTFQKGKGIGTKIFADQVKHLSENGFDRMVTFAIGGNKFDTDHNGYYTWARLGYDTKVDDLVNANDVKKHFPNAKMLSDVMATPEGRTYWKQNGTAFMGEFDLKPGSRSHAILNAYLEEKNNGKSTAGGSAGPIPGGSSGTGSSMGKSQPGDSSASVSTTPTPVASGSPADANGTGKGVMGAEDYHPDEYRKLM